MVRRGLVGSREQASDAIRAGQVLVGGAVAAKAGHLVSPSEPVTVAQPESPYVGRGGIKLAAALDTFALEVAGRRALDAGASTGGFTDCLLQRGATSVTAVDVGRGQLHERLRHDVRVQVHERTNIRHATLEQLGGRPFDLVVADLSFISLRTVAPALLGPLSAPAADVVVLIKPQFEAGRAAASKGRGVIRDPDIWSATLKDVLGAMAGREAAMMGLMVSPVTGGDGNVEFLAWLRAHTLVEDQDAVVEAAVVTAVAEAMASHGMKDH